MLQHALYSFTRGDESKCKAAIRSPPGHSSEAKSHHAEAAHPQTEVTVLVLPTRSQSDKLGRKLQEEPRDGRDLQLPVALPGARPGPPHAVTSPDCQLSWRGCGWQGPKGCLMQQRHHLDSPDSRRVGHRAPPHPLGGKDRPLVSRTRES